jgi:hypothetical protein
VVAFCVVACVGAAVAFAVVGTGGGSNDKKSALPTTGGYAPLTIWRPPLIRVGPLILDAPDSPPQVWLSTRLSPLPAHHHYQVTVLNVSSIGFINSLQWYPPAGVRILKVLGSSTGHCGLTGLSGFGGNQFKTVLLYPNVQCDGLALKSPSCTCKGDGGSVTFSFVSDRDTPLAGGSRVLSATPLLKPVPSFSSS